MSTVTPSPGRRGSAMVPLLCSVASSSVVSRWRSGELESSVGRNSTKRQTSGAAAARCTAAAMPMPLFQQCGATLLPCAAAIRQTRRASVSPPTRPASGCSTPMCGSSGANSCRVACHSP
eukprot:scaffold21940_cov69-Phaeocystis_antarctica.AAC.5